MTRLALLAQRSVVPAAGQPAVHTLKRKDIASILTIQPSVVLVLVLAGITDCVVQTAMALVRKFFSSKLMSSEKMKRLKIINEFYGASSATNSKKEVSTMNKWVKRISLLLAIIMLAVTVAPTTTAHAAAKSPITKITGQPIKNGINKWGRDKDFAVTPFFGSYYYRTTVTFAKSSKKTKLKLKYSHQVRQSKPGTVKLTVGKKTVTICKFKSFPYKQEYNIDDDVVTKVYLESVEIKTGKKWKKVKITNDGVKAGDIYSEMKPFTLKKIPKGTKMRFTFNIWRVGASRR